MIFFKNTVSDKSESIIYFNAIENDNTLGRCTLVLNDGFANVTELTFDKSAPFVSEGLLKSAYNYASLKNYYMAKCSASDISGLLVRLGFELKNGEYICDIPTILTGSCCECRK